jgi:hypothetical protein
MRKAIGATSAGEVETAHTIRAFIQAIYEGRRNSHPASEVCNLNFTFRYLPGFNRLPAADDGQEERSAAEDRGHGKQRKEGRGRLPGRVHPRRRETRPPRHR